MRGGKEGFQIIIIFGVQAVCYSLTHFDNCHSILLLPSPSGSLQDNGIGDDGARALGEALQTNTSLTILRYEEKEEEREGGRREGRIHVCKPFAIL